MQSKVFIAPILRILVISSPLWLNDFYLPHIPKDADQLRATLDFLFFVCWQSTLIYMGFQAGWYKFADLGLIRVNLAKQILQGLILLIIVLLVMIGLAALRMVLAKWFNVHIPPPEHTPLPNWNPVFVFLYVVYLAVSAGVFEEIVYRGIVISQLRRVSENRILLTCGSAFVFAMIHWSLGPAIMILAFALGLFWAILFVRFRSLLPLVMAHGLFDFITFFHGHVVLLRSLGLDE